MANDIVKVNHQNELESKITHIDGVAMEVTLSEDSKSIIQKLLPDKRKRAKALHELQIIKIESDFRERVLKSAREAQLQSIQDMFNDYMVKGKTIVRKERLEFYTEQFNILMASVIKASDIFEKETQKAWEESEKSIPLIKEKKQKMIEQMISDFFATVEKLKKDFLNILDENIKV